MKKQLFTAALALTVLAGCQQQQQEEKQCCKDKTSPVLTIVGG